MKFSKCGLFEIFRGLNCYTVAFLNSEDLIRYGKLVLNLDAIIYKGKMTTTIPGHKIIRDSRTRTLSSAFRQRYML